jgi:hypothetical protein
MTNLAIYILTAVEKLLGVRWNFVTALVQRMR